MKSLGIINVEIVRLIFENLPLNFAEYNYLLIFDYGLIKGVAPVINLMWLVLTHSNSTRTPKAKFKHDNYGYHKANKSNKNKKRM